MSQRLLWLNARSMGNNARLAAILGRCDLKMGLVGLSAVLLCGTLLASVAVAQVKQGSWTPVVESMDRGYSSISYWTYRDDGVEIGGGRVSIEHGKPRWPAAMTEAQLDDATVAKLWRLGNNKWTTLDTQLTLVFGERTVRAGIYYLVLQRPTAGDWRLAFVSPSAVAPGFIDAWAAQARPQEIPILFSIPLEHAKSAPSKELDITFALEDSDMSKGSLAIDWGPHRLQTVFELQVPSPEFYRGSGN